MLKRRLSWLLAAALVLGIVCAASIKWVVFPGRAFDPMAWRTDAKSQDGTRQAMADRLLARGTLMGLTREEVLAQLGVPPSTDSFAEWDFVYWLGPERGFMGIDSEWLVLRMASNGRVAEARLVTD